jgi:hypothetical protein
LKGFASSAYRWRSFNDSVGISAGRFTPMGLGVADVARQAVIFIMKLNDG